MNKTKCVVLGGEKTTDKVLKPIVFEKCVRHFDEKIERAEVSPKGYDNIILLRSSGSNGGLDHMYAYNDGRPDTGYIYLGHWNDGVV